MTGMLVSLIIAYLAGSVPTAVWVGKWFYNVDVRNAGSGNAGATNTIRVLGVKAGIPVLLIDVLKGYFAVWAVQPIMTLTDSGEASPLLMIGAATAAVIGHTLPVFAGFRGGKGVATLLGVGLGLFPAAAWVAVALFTTLIVIFRYVSLASIVAGITFPLVVFFVFPSPHWTFDLLAVFVALFLPFTHRKNIVRLLNGTESKVHFRKRDSQK